MNFLKEINCQKIHNLGKNLYTYFVELFLDSNFRFILNFFEGKSEILNTCSSRGVGKCFTFHRKDCEVNADRDRL